MLQRGAQVLRAGRLLLPEHAAAGSGGSWPTSAAAAVQDLGYQPCAGAANLPGAAGSRRGAVCSGAQGGGELVQSGPN